MKETSLFEVHLNLSASRSSYFWHCSNEINKLCYKLSVAWRNKI